MPAVLLRELRITRDVVPVTRVNPSNANRVPAPESHNTRLGDDARVFFSVAQTLRASAPDSKIRP